MSGQTCEIHAYHSNYYKLHTKSVSMLPQSTPRGHWETILEQTNTHPDVSFIGIWTNYQFKAPQACLKPLATQTARNYIKISFLK